MARRWPPLVTWVTGISAAAAGVRAVALARVLSRWGLGFRARQVTVSPAAMQGAARHCQQCEGELSDLRPRLEESTHAHFSDLLQAGSADEKWLLCIVKCYVAPSVCGQTEGLQGVHDCVWRRYTPGSGKALAVVLAMRGGMADNIRRRMHWTDRLALNVVGGLVLPLTVAGEEQKVTCLFRVNNSCTIQVLCTPAASSCRSLWLGRSRRCVRTIVVTPLTQ